LTALLWAAPAPAADTQDPNYDQVRQDYRAYLQQLKQLGAQYKEVTAEMKKILREEGMPTFDAATGDLEVAAGSAGGADVSQTDREMTVTLDLPGLRRDSLKVLIEDNRRLKVSGQRRTASGEVPVERALELPAFAQQKGTVARYEDGVLTVTIRKLDSQPSAIEVPVR
jgi:HSP20 family molecular chaperone IbpA